MQRELIAVMARDQALAYRDRPFRHAREVTMSAIRRIVGLLAATSLWSTAAQADNDPQKSPEYCGACHQRIYQEWKASPMGSDLTNPIVKQLYVGLNSRNQPDGLGYQGMFPGHNGDCADCHVPTLVINERAAGRGDVDLARAMDLKLDHGISCQFCHTLTDVHIRRQADGRYERRIFERVALENGERKFGPRMTRDKGPQSPAHPTVASPLLKDSRLCGVCHLNQEDKVLAISTYEDWKALYDAGATKDTCQSCHMPLHPGPVEVASGFAPREGVRSHAFPGARDPAMLQRALDLKLDVRVDGGQLIVATRVENVGAAHPVPGSGPIRNVILKIDATDAKGRALAFVGDPKLLLPPLAGIGNPQTKQRDDQDWAGLPGRFYAKVLKGVHPKTGRPQEGVPGFIADGVAFDTTLKPGQPDMAQFRFALPDGADAGEIVNVTARLVYR
ncbi:MAG: hypothetical protein HXY24_18355, partial [Rubrivivax sp.]|nr:hypothetical protein [Rubrivivax sp.]